MKQTSIQSTVQDNRLKRGQRGTDDETIFKKKNECIDRKIFGHF